MRGTMIMESKWEKALSLTRTGHYPTKDIFKKDCHMVKEQLSWEIYQSRPNSLKVYRFNINSC